MRTATRRLSRGAAIISVLLVVVLASIVVASLFTREHVAIRSIENRLAIAQTRWVERAAIDWARVVLRSDDRTSSGVDHLGEPWALAVEETRLDETVTAGARIDDPSRAATLNGAIEDAQGRLNLTGLASVGPGGAPQVDQTLLDAFRRLLRNLGQPESLAEVVAARILDSVPSTEGGVRRAGRQLPLMRAQDLRSLPGFGEDAVVALAPLVAFLPVRTKVNVNTARSEVLSAVIGELDPEAARRFVLRRENTFYRTLADAGAAMGLADTSQLGTLLDVKSAYFIVRGMVRFGRVEALTESLLERGSNSVVVVWQYRY